MIDVRGRLGRLGGRCPGARPRSLVCILFLQGVAKRFAYVAGHFFQALGIEATLIDSRRSPYLVIGDWPAGLCLLICAALALTGIWKVVASKYRLVPAVNS